MPKSIIAPQHILISRTDAIGDVVLTLPMAAFIKQLLPGAVVSFLGSTYTGPVINAFKAIDNFINYDEIKRLSNAAQVKFIMDKKVDVIIHVFPNKNIARIGKQANIKIRIGTKNRIFHWLYCNRLVKLSRKKSHLHEAQLNLILLKPLGLINVPQLSEIIKHNCFETQTPLPLEIAALLLINKFNLIIHPKSHGSGIEWGLENFANLISLLPAEKYNVIVTGSEKERPLLSNWIKTLPSNVVDLTGKLTLLQLISFINSADGLIASGTGPLHIAAMSGINTLGLFPSCRPIHPERWAPIGIKATFIESGENDLATISPLMVFQKVQLWKK